MVALELPEPTLTLPTAQSSSAFVSGTLHRLYQMGQPVTQEDLMDEVEDGVVTVGRKLGGSGQRKGGSSGGMGGGSSRGTVSLADLVSSGILVPGRGRITCTYKGTVATASLMEDGSIEHQGRRYQSATAFSIGYKRTMNPGKQGDDGWKSVCYDGKPLDYYRKIYQEMARNSSVPISDNYAH